MTTGLEEAVKMRRYEDISKYKYNSGSNVSITLEYIEKIMNKHVIRL